MCDIVYWCEMFCLQTKMLLTAKKLQKTRDENAEKHLTKRAQLVARDVVESIHTAYATYRHHNP